MIGVGTLALFPGVAVASDPPVPPPDPLARICNAFGEGYHLVPGTLTCVKFGGSISVTISAGSQGPPREGSASPPSAPR